MGAPMNDAGIRLLVSVFLVLGNACFVAAEYALVGCRRSRIETLARKGNRMARRVLEALRDIAIYIAGIQIAITMFGLALGAITEPLFTELLSDAFGTRVDRNISFALSLLIVTYVTVVIGELVPKYIALDRADALAMAFIYPLSVLVTFFRPLIWLIQVSGSVLVRPLGIKPQSEESDAVPKDELLLLIRAGSTEGLLEKEHASLVTRALQLDKLNAQDVMIHRLDIAWLDVNTTREELIEKLREIPHTRIPVCRGDIDDLVGIVYLHDIVRTLDEPRFSLEQIVRQAVMIPENLALEKVVERMREARTQMLIVLDEYGGTSGLLTLEDVVEEVFGELEDGLETERPTIEIFSNGRISARAEVRYDELVARLGIETHEDPPTDTLAELLVNQLQRVPKLGDGVETDLGHMRIENMARRRITRISLQLSAELLERIGKLQVNPLGAADRSTSAGS